jgi:hypothetical protein
LGFTPFDRIAPGAVVAEARFRGRTVNDEVEANQQRSRRLYEEVFGRGNYSVADEILAEDA